MTAAASARFSGGRRTGASVLIMAHTSVGRIGDGVTRADHGFFAQWEVVAILCVRHEPAKDPGCISADAAVAAVDRALPSPRWRLAQPGLKKGTSCRSLGRWS